MRRSVGIAAVLLALSAVTLDVAPLPAAETEVDKTNPPVGQTTSFCQTWASDDKNGLVFSNPAQNQHPTGALVQCRSYGVNPAPDNWADTTVAGQSVQASSATNGVNVPNPTAIKCTKTYTQQCSRQERFIAVAAWAQYGVVAAPMYGGHLRGAGVVQMTKDGLVLTGNEGPTQSRVISMLSDLPPKHVNGELLKEILGDEGLRRYKPPEGWTVGYPRNRYLVLDVELHYDGTLKVNQASALKLCPSADFANVDTMCAKAEGFLTPEDFWDPCLVARQPEYCQKFGRGFFHRQSRKLAYPVWIDIPDNVSITPVALDVVHCAKEVLPEEVKSMHYKSKDYNICRLGPR